MSDVRNDNLVQSFVNEHTNTFTGNSPFDAGKAEAKKYKDPSPQQHNETYQDYSDRLSAFYGANEN